MDQLCVVVAEFHQALAVAFERDPLLGSEKPVKLLFLIPNSVLFDYDAACQVLK